MNDCHGIMYIHEERINPNDFGNVLTFPLAPSSGQNVNLSNCFMCHVLCVIYLQI